MARTGLRDAAPAHEDAAALILARAQARYGTATMMADDDSDDDDDDDDDDDSDDDDSDDDDDKGKAGKKGDEDEDEDLGPKGLKALRDQRAENRRLKRENRELRNGKPGDKADKDSGKDAEAAEAAAVERARALAKPILVKAEARTALATAGLIGSPDRLLRMLDLDDIDVVYDRKGNVDDIDGLADLVKELKREYPELFRKKGSSSINGGGGTRDAGKPKSASERQAAYLRGE